MNDKHCEIIDNSIKNNTTNDKKLIYTFSKRKKPLTEDEVKEIGDKEAADKYGTILDVRKEGSI